MGTTDAIPPVTCYYIYALWRSDEAFLVTSALDNDYVDVIGVICTKGPGKGQGQRYMHALIRLVKRSD